MFSKTIRINRLCKQFWSLFSSIIWIVSVMKKWFTGKSSTDQIAYKAKYRSRQPCINCMSKSHPLFRSKLNPAGGVKVGRADRKLRFACVALLKMNSSSSLVCKRFIQHPKKSRLSFHRPIFLLYQSRMNETFHQSLPLKTRTQYNKINIGSNATRRQGAPRTRVSSLFIGGEIRPNNRCTLFRPVVTI